MAQPVMTMRNRGFKVILGLLVCMGLLLMSLPGAGALSPAQAQEPDVSASAITQNVSASVNINNSYTFTGTQIVTISRNVAVSLNVTVRCWNPFTINATAGLSGNVPVTITYGFPTRQVNTSIAMSGNGTASQSLGCPLGGGTFVWPVSFTVPVSGQLTLTTQGTEGGAIVQGNGTVSGQATIWVTGSATLVTFTYLPMIARSDIYWFDDFSSKKGWVNYKCTDQNNRLVDCNCKMEIEDGRLRVTLNDERMRCFVGPPSDVQLREGVFSVEARKRNDNETWYGLLFNVSTRLHKQRWALEARPFGGSGCASDKGLVWLSYITDGLGTGRLWAECTDSLELGKDKWNKLTAVRRVDNVKVYINDEELDDLEQNNGNLKDQPFFNLEVMSEDQTPVVVEFDNFVLRY